MLHVEDGAAVEEGDSLCEIEAMKTFCRVSAQASGVVHWSVELGEVVDAGDVLGEIV
jgi:biotin carboxyl carrier protein